MKEWMRGRARVAETADSQQSQAKVLWRDRGLLLINLYRSVRQTQRGGADMIFLMFQYASLTSAETIVLWVGSVLVHTRYVTAQHINTLVARNLTRGAESQCLIERRGTVAMAVLSQKLTS